MSSEVTQHDDSYASEVLGRLKRDPRFLSGNLEGFAALQEQVSLGETALKPLIQCTDLSRPEIQALAEIAKTLDKPIPFSIESQGNHGETKKQIGCWATYYGYKTED